MRQLPFGKPIIGDAEKHAVLEVLDGPILVHGPRAESFETAFAEFTGAPHAVSVSSCTAALHLAYFHLGIGPGDEVIIPAQTHTATAHAIEYTGARAVFVDSEIQTGNIDIDQIENYMSYNSCQNMLTEGQKVRMRGFIASFPILSGLSADSNLYATGIINAIPINMEDDDNKRKMISVMPNPFLNTINITTRIKAIEQIYITNILGQEIDFTTEVSTDTGSNQSFSLNMSSDIIPGIYFLLIRSGSETIVEKLLKK